MLYIIHIYYVIIPLLAVISDGKYSSEIPILIPRVLDAIERAVQFLKVDFEGINVDGLFGARLGEGQLISALEEYGVTGENRLLKEKLSKLSLELSQICNKITNNVEQKEYEYYLRFENTLISPYYLRYTPRTFSDYDVIGDHASEYDEESGDVCYAMLLGTYLGENERLVPACTITDKCWKMMTMKGARGYGATHQLLYFIFGEQMNCRMTLEKRLDNPLENIQSELCRNIYGEAVYITKTGSVDHNDQDLFLEQCVLCGSLGFEDFYRLDWMKMVLKWQSEAGCFKEEEPELFTYTVSERSSMRRLLRENDMTDGCLSHKSGLGIGLILSYLRYLLRMI